MFAKVPEPGRVKTRLCPPLSPEQAAALYDAFLRDALDRYAALGAAAGGPAVRLYLGGAAREPADLVPDGVSVHPQRGDGLGERMLRAFVETFAAGHGRAVVVGTDHPTLPDSFFGLAFEALGDPMTAVLGPSDDGGYYLLGLNEVTADLFDMDYSHASVFDDTMERVMENDPHAGRPPRPLRRRRRGHARPPRRRVAGRGGGRVADGARAPGAGRVRGGGRSRTGHPARAGW